MIGKIKSIIDDWKKWTYKEGECGRGTINGIFCRNWRTWAGHSLIADLVTAISMMPLLFTGAWWAVAIGVLGYVGINLFYVNREFNPKTGNFFEKTDPRIANYDRNDKQLDSVLDAVVPFCTSTFLKFNFVPVVAIAIAAIQLAVTYLVYRMDTD